MSELFLAQIFMSLGEKEDRESRSNRILAVNCVCRVILDRLCNGAIRGDSNAALVSWLKDYQSKLGLACEAEPENVYLQYQYQMVSVIMTSVTNKRMEQNGKYQSLVADLVEKLSLVANLKKEIDQLGDDEGIDTNG